MENVNVFPQVYKHRVNAAGECTIVIAVSLNRKIVATEKLHKKVLLKDWDEEIKLTRSNHMVNSLIKQRKAELENEFTRAQLLGTKITASFINKVLSGDQSNVSFFDFATELLEKKRLKDGRSYDRDTKRRYKNEIDRMRLFSPNLQLKDINTEFITGYNSWLLNTHLAKDGKKLHKNSVWKALSFLRMICNDAIKEGYIHKDNYPFLNFEIGRFITDMEKIKYLNIQQVISIEKALTDYGHLLDPMAVRVGWRFLCMCVFGFRISDAMRLNDSFINDAGHIEFKPHKTRHSQNVANVPIVSDRQRYYLQQTLSLPILGKDPKNFRNAFNYHLQAVGALAKVSVHLTSHVGRHTMGSFTIDADMNEEAAKAILGVKSNNTIKVYRHLKQSKLLSEASKLNNIF